MEELSAASAGSMSTSTADNSLRFSAALGAAAAEPAPVIKQLLESLGVGAQPDEATLDVLMDDILCSFLEAKTDAKNEGVPRALPQISMRARAAYAFMITMKAIALGEMVADPCIKEFAERLGGRVNKLSLQAKMNK